MPGGDWRDIYRFVAWMITGSLCSIGFTVCRHGTYMDTNREKTRMKEKKHDEGEKHMVTLTETTEIAAPFEKLEWWVDHFEEEFVKWSPLHLECELLSGGIQAGDKVRFHEIVMGMDYDVTGTIIRAERDRDHFSFAFESDKKLPSSHLRESGPIRVAAFAIQRALACRRRS